MSFYSDSFFGGSDASAILFSFFIIAIVVTLSFSIDIERSISTSENKATNKALKKTNIAIAVESTILLLIVYL